MGERIWRNVTEMTYNFGGQERRIYGKRNNRKHWCIAISTFPSLCRTARELGFNFQQLQNRLSDPPGLVSNLYRSYFPRGKVAGAWSWQLTSMVWCFFRLPLKYSEHGSWRIKHRGCFVLFYAQHVITATSTSLWHIFLRFLLIFTSHSKYICLPSHLFSCGFILKNVSV